MSRNKTDYTKKYARDSSVSLPKNSSIFKLEENYKCLPVNILATNLKVYLSKVNCNASASWNDFDKAISTLKDLLPEKC